MLKIINVIMLSLLLLGCDSRKEYKYVEIFDDYDLLTNSIQTEEKKPEIFKSKNDSTAFLKAYSNFCISVKVNKEVSEAMRGQTYSAPKDFKLLDEKGNNIVYITFYKYDLDKGMREVEKLVFEDRLKEFTKNKFKK